MTTPNTETQKLKAELAEVHRAYDEQFRELRTLKAERDRLAAAAHEVSRVYRLIWGEEGIPNNQLDVAVNRLRAALKGEKAPAGSTVCQHGGEPFTCPICSPAPSPLTEARCHHTRVYGDNSPCPECATEAAVPGRDIQAETFEKRFGVDPYIHPPCPVRGSIPTQRFADFCSGWHIGYDRGLDVGESELLKQVRQARADAFEEAAQFLDNEIDRCWGLMDRCARRFRDKAKQARAARIG